MARSRGSFGTASRAVIDHFKTLDAAARILETEHGTRHKPGERPDLCPKCKTERKPDQLTGKQS